MYIIMEQAQIQLYRGGEVTMNTYTTFLILVEGVPHSRHRSPIGLYRIDVITDNMSLDTAATSVLEAAKYNIPFLNELTLQYSVRIFLESGEELKLPKPTYEHDDGLTCYCGRVTDNSPIAILY